MTRAWAGKEQDARVNVSLLDNPKFEALTPGAVTLWLYVLLWTVRSRSDGFIRRRQSVGLVPGLGLGEPSAELSELVAVGLLVPCADGWRVHDWADYQTTNEEWQVNADGWRERKHRSRLRACADGRHSTDCPTTDLAGNPWACPLRAGDGFPDASGDASPTDSVTASVTRDVTRDKTRDAGKGKGKGKGHGVQSPPERESGHFACADCGWDLDSREHYAACEPTWPEPGAPGPRGDVP